MILHSRGQISKAMTPEDKPIGKIPNGTSRGLSAMHKLSKLIVLFVGALALGLLLDFIMLKLPDRWIVVPLWNALILLIFVTAAKLFEFSMDALVSLLGEHHPNWMWVDNVISVFLITFWLVALYVSIALVNGGFGGIL